MCKAAKREAMTLALIDYNFNLTPDIRFFIIYDTNENNYLILHKFF